MLTTSPKSQFITIPRREYEEFVELRKVIPILKATRSDVVAINRGKKK